MNVTNAPYVRRTPTPLLFRVTPRRTLFLPAGDVDTWAGGKWLPAQVATSPICRGRSV